MKEDLKYNVDYIIKSRMGCVTPFRIKVLDVTKTSYLIQNIDSQGTPFRVLIDEFYDKYRVLEEID